MEAKESAPRLDVQEILPNLGMFGDAMSSDTTSKRPDSFVKYLVFSTTDLVDQLEILNDNIVKQFNNEERLLREELSEQKAKEKQDPNVGYTSAFKEMNLILEDMKKTLEELLDVAGAGTELSGGAGTGSDLTSLLTGGLIGYLGGGGDLGALGKQLLDFTTGDEAEANPSDKPKTKEDYKKTYNTSIQELKKGENVVQNTFKIAETALTQTYNTVKNIFGSTVQSQEQPVTAVSQPSYTPATEPAVEQFKQGTFTSGESLTKDQTEKLFPQYTAKETKELINKGEAAKSGSAKVSSETSLTNQLSPTVFDDKTLESPETIKSSMLPAESIEDTQKRFESNDISFSDVVTSQAIKSELTEGTAEKIEQQTNEVDAMESSTIMAPPIVTGGDSSSSSPMSPMISAVQGLNSSAVDDVPDPNFFGGTLELELLA